MTTESSNGHVRLSIIIPVYNNPDHVRTAVDCAVQQSVLGGQTEVIVVNDGSTDGTASVLAELESQYRNLRVVHQENSGWAGAPRNAGLDCAVGDYVFFHDADDHLNGDCLGNAVGYADEHSCDVLLVKIEGRGGRYTHTDVFDATYENADIRKLVRSNFCFKLFRRSFLLKYGIRFPDQPIRLEDAQFCFRAYALSSKSSILSDQTYYYVYNHGAGHISNSPTPAKLHASGIRESLEPLRYGPWKAEILREAMADYFRRVVLSRFNEHFKQRPLEFRLTWVHEASRLVKEYAVPFKLYDFYVPLARAQVWALSTNNTALVEAVSRQSNRSRTVLTEVDDVRIGRGRVSLAGVAVALLKTQDFKDLRFYLSKDGRRYAELDALLTAEKPGIENSTCNTSKRFTVDIPIRLLLRRGAVKLYANAIDEEGRRTKMLRVGLGASSSSTSRSNMPWAEVYPTELGGLNLRAGLGIRSVLRKLTFAKRGVVGIRGSIDTCVSRNEAK